MYNYDELIKNLRLSDFAPYLAAYGSFGQLASPQDYLNAPPLDKTFFEKRPLARPGTQFASNSVGNRGIVLNPANRTGEFYPDPSPEETNRQLDQFHQGTPAADWPIKGLGGIDENWRQKAVKYFTG